MTDNEIMKALGCCVKLDCKKCNLKTRFKTATNCRNDLLVTALDLINRQKAEIERLQKHNTVVAHKHYNDGIKDCAELLEAAAEEQESIYFKTNQSKTQAAFAGGLRRAFEIIEVKQDRENAIPKNDFEKENEVLQAKIRLLEKKYFNDTEHLRSEIDRISALLRTYTLRYGPDTAISEKIAEIKAEAFEEFVEDLKNACREQCILLYEDLFEVVAYIAERVLDKKRRENDEKTGNA